MIQSEYRSVYVILEKIDASSFSNAFILLTYYILMLSLWYLGSMFEIKTFSLIYFENRVDVTHNNPFTMADTSLESILLVLHITTAFWVLLDNFTSSAFQSVSCFITRIPQLTAGFPKAYAMYLGNVWTHEQWSRSVSWCNLDNWIHSGLYNQPHLVVVVDRFKFLNKDIIFDSPTDILIVRYQL